MNIISAAVANRQFSALLRRVAQGETLTVTSRGKPVATISPPLLTSDVVREQARARLERHLQSVRPTAVERNWVRDELYD